jgi:hypothetical protein
MNQTITERQLQAVNERDKEKRTVVKHATDKVIKKSYLTCASGTVNYG